MAIFIIELAVLKFPHLCLVLFAVTSGEFCDYETFEADCDSHETLMISSAVYGHISMGKCIKIDLGVFGCQADVTNILQHHCNGKTSCSLAVNDEALRNTAPCTAGIAVFLRATYMCVKGKFLVQLFVIILFKPWLQRDVNRSRLEIRLKGCKLYHWAWMGTWWYFQLGMYLTLSDDAFDLFTIILLTTNHDQRSEKSNLHLSLAHLN